ncbi:MAG: hypothetical protein HY898_16400 [Deltaproteobacteria bacterium]|nr:hypothetical protein [Deltaproteobacteria bacterium]
MASWILTGVIVAVSVALAWIGAAMKRELPVLQSIVFGGFIIALVWVPRTWSDVLLALLVGAAAAIVPDSWLWKAAVAAIVAAVLWVPMHYMPGGGAALVLGVVLVAAFFQTRSGVRYIAMLRSAKRLDPHSHVMPKEPVAIGGKVMGGSVATDLVCANQGDLAAIQVRTGTADHFAAPRLLLLETEAGTVGVDLSSAELRSSNLRPLPEEDRQTLRTRCGASEQVPSVAQVLSLGSDAYVVGVPEWEAAEQLRGYRDSSRIPVFRSRPGFLAFVVDKTEREELLDARWDLFRWILWGAVSAAVVLTGWIGVR